MARTPDRWSVRASESFLQQLVVIYPLDRSTSGRPSRNDFIELYLPVLTSAIGVAPNAGAAVPGFEGVVEYVIRAHLSFPPSRVTAILDEESESVVLIGYQADNDYWDTIGDDPVG